MENEWQNDSWGNVWVIHHRQKQETRESTGGKKNRRREKKNDEKLLHPTKQKPKYAPPSPCPAVMRLAPTKHGARSITGHHRTSVAYLFNHNEQPDEERNATIGRNSKSPAVAKKNPDGRRSTSVQVTRSNRSRYKAVRTRLGCD